MPATSLQLTQGTTSYLGPSAPPANGLTPDQIVNSLGKWPGGRCRATCLDVATTGNLPAYNSPGCSGTVSGRTLNISGALAAAGAKAGAFELAKTALKGVPIVGNILESLASFVSLPFAHHAQAVKTEQATLCQAVPWAMQLLQGVDELFLSGQIDAPTASAALDNGLQQFLQMVKPIYQDSGNQLNAAGCYGRYLKAAILYRKNNYSGALSVSTRASNDLFPSTPSAGPAIPAGSTGQLQPAASGWNTPSKAGVAVAPATLAQSVLGGFDSSKLALAVLVLVVLGFGVVINAAAFRRIK